MIGSYIRYKAWKARRPWITQLTKKPWTARNFRTFRNRLGDNWIAPAEATLLSALPLRTRARWMIRSRRFFVRGKWAAYAGASIVGAGLMYFFNPQRVERIKRQQLLNGPGAHAGKGAFARKFFRSRMSADDALSHKVRSRLRRALRNAGSIAVRAQQGRVTLRGLASSRDSEQLSRLVRGVRGVKEFENRLESFEDEHGQGQQLRERAGQAIREHAGQGSERRARRRTIAGATVGGALILAGLRQRSIASAVAGSWLLARAVKRRDYSQYAGGDVPQRGIEVHKTIHVDAPAARAYAAWNNFENFPAYLRHVRRVRRVEDGGRSKHPRWRWTVDGPAGTEVEFDTLVVASESDRLLAWRTDADSPVQHAGVAHFNENPDGSSTVEIHMSYDPPAGILGHAVAKLFGADPSNQMDDDLVRLKSFIESSGGRQQQQPHETGARKQQGQENRSSPAARH